MTQTFYASQQTTTGTSRIASAKRCPLWKWPYILCVSKEVLMGWLYRIQVADSPKGLATQVQLLLDEGWQLYKQPFTHTVYYSSIDCSGREELLCQALVKWKEPTP